ncbi:histidine kinase [Arsenicicoccus piscis]|uniref:histidine kinase n=1 Tax=Arsenicicoccus piscis TaxID=673954 RepID=UPI0024E049CA|nr:histidine kinase [Arsenicicoccus piscis]
MVDLLVIVLCIGFDLVMSGFPTELRAGGHLPVWVVPVATTVVYAALYWRNRRPTAVFTVLWAFSLLSALLVADFIPFVGLFMALLAAGRHLPRRVSVGFVAIALAPFAVNTVNAQQHTHASVASSLLVFLVWVVLAVGFWLVGYRERRVRTRHQEAEERLTAEAHRAVAAERQRIARELHDSLAHSITAMTLQAAGASSLLALPAATGAGVRVSPRPTLPPPPRARPTPCPTHGSRGPSARSRPRGPRPCVSCTGCSGAAHAGHHRGRRRPGLPGSTPAGGPRTVARGQPGGRAAGRARHRGDARPAGPERRPRRLPRRPGGAGQRHEARRPGATCGVYLVWTPDTVSLRVRTTAGFVSEGERLASGGFGLVGLAERVELVGGTFEAGPVEGGFITSATLPTRDAGSGEIPVVREELA